MKSMFFFLTKTILLNKFHWKDKIKIQQSNQAGESGFYGELKVSWNAPHTPQHVGHCS